MGMIALALDTLYSTVSLVYGDHWQLKENELKLLSDSLDKALKTLPDNLYGSIRKQFETIVPWIGLGVAAITVTVPRIEESRRRSKDDRVKEQNNVYDFETSGREQGQASEPYDQPILQTDSIFGYADGA